MLDKLYTVLPETHANPRHIVQRYLEPMHTAGETCCHTVWHLLMLLLLGFVYVC